MLGSLGGVTVAASVLGVRRFPWLVPLAWFVFVIMAVLVQFGVTSL